MGATLQRIWLELEGQSGLCVANGASSVSVLLGQGDGTFATKVDYATEGSSDSLVIGDLNRDGALDIAATTYWFNWVSVLMGQGDGTFVALEDMPYVYTAAHDLAAGDLNGDSILDLVVIELDGDGHADLVVGSCGPDTVGVMRGRGDGTFAPEVDYVVGGAPVTGEGVWNVLAIGDLNVDGRLDLAVTNIDAHTVNVLLNTCR
jgi:hypothetical protein